MPRLRRSWAAEERARYAVPLRGASGAQAKVGRIRAAAGNIAPGAFGVVLSLDVRHPIARLSRASRQRPPEARHPLAQPVRAGSKGKEMASTVGAAPNQKHISDQTRFRVSSTTQQTPHQNPFSCDVLPDSVCTESRRELPKR
jgi:hypothetical protein